LNSPNRRVYSKRALNAEGPGGHEALEVALRVTVGFTLTAAACVLRTSARHSSRYRARPRGTIPVRSTIPVHSWTEGGTGMPLRAHRAPAATDLGPER